ncbi:MAG: PIN domain-containing protein [Candidatus Dormibacteraeota bacterium]|nr:PIN domain-containing protein [Candidatus Dormibacteraeota bacterium]
MSGSAAYLDTSAFLKLVVTEPESAALARVLERWPERASAALLRTEAIRALRRARLDDRVGPARRLIRRVRLISLDHSLLDRATELEPRNLRSLDALHLAAAATLGDDLGSFITYDDQLGAEATAAGFPVASPR